MSFSRTSLTFNNNGCGYAGCGSHNGFYSGATPFSGKYIYGAGNGGFFTIQSLGADFIALEFISGTGFNGVDAHTFAWEAYNNGGLAGSGNATVTGPTIVGFKDTAGFDELRYSRISSINPTFRVGDSNFVAPALDSVRAQFMVAAVPEPSSLAMFGIGACLMGFGAVRRRRPEKSQEATT